jgi:hypothetical protein
MNRTWLSVVVVGLVATIVSFAVVRRLAPTQVPRLDALQDVEWLKGALRLTPGQVKRIGELQPEFGRKLSACCDRHCQARGQVLGALLASTNGIEKAREHVEEMCRAQADSEMATLEHIQRVYEVLTPEQQSLYKDRLNALTCSECAACGPSTCTRTAVTGSGG